MSKRVQDKEGAAHLSLVSGAALLHPEETVFEAMLDGWSAQQMSRLLASKTIHARMLMVRRFAAFTNDYPWNWGPADVEEWTTSLRSEGARTHSTLRNYHCTLELFMSYLTDPRYGWADECEARFGTHPVQICHDWNTGAHRTEFEGRPGNRPFARDELQTFFDYADERVDFCRQHKRKGWLAAFRDATLLKVAYAWGLRRTEVTMLDVTDFGSNPEAPDFGGYGRLGVRFGKASRGSSPKRRTVLTVMGWAAEAVSEYVTEIRPRYGPGPALWPTERTPRLSASFFNARFAAYRDALGLAEELTPHCLRHSYITHLIEDGFDPLFVQHQVGHEWGSTTAIYTGVSSDYKNRVLKDALARAFAQEEE